MPEPGGVEAFYDRLSDHDHPHLLEDGDLERAIASMAACARPGGAVAVSVRDYDAQLTPEGVRVFGEPPERHGVVVFWHWELEAALATAGQRDVRRLSAEESGYYQPLVVGTRP